jgi:hypothetical protein
VEDEGYLVIQRSKDPIKVEPDGTVIEVGAVSRVEIYLNEEGLEIETGKLAPMSVWELTKYMINDTYIEYVV